MEQKEGCAVKPKPRTQKCAGCTPRTDVKDLMWVLNRLICEPCGKAEIDTWNKKVRER